MALRERLQIMPNTPELRAATPAKRMRLEDDIRLPPFLSDIIPLGG